MRKEKMYETANKAQKRGSKLDMALTYVYACIHAAAEAGMFSTIVSIEKIFAYYAYTMLEEDGYKVVIEPSSRDKSRELITIYWEKENE